MGREEKEKKRERQQRKREEKKKEEQKFMRRFQKAAALAIGVCMTVSALAGCGGQSGESEMKTETKQEAVTEQASGQSTEETGITFPLEEQVTLTMWAPFNVNAASVMEDYNGSLVFQEMEKRTNVHIEFIHPAIGQDSEQFNLMIASQEYPDMIMGGISNYVGGEDLAVEDGVFLQLNDLIDQYAPNYKAILESNPEAKRQASSDSGIMSSILPMMRQENLCWYGPVIRKDWLEETGLDIPETLEEWEVLLTEMKKNHPDSTPLIFHPSGASAGNSFRERGYDFWGLFMSAYGIGTSSGTFGAMYNDNGTVKYAPIEDGFKDYLEVMNRWYENGLIDADYPARDMDGVNALITSGMVGAMVGSVDIASNLFDSQGVEYVAAPYPVLKEGDPVRLRAYDAVASPIGNSVSITTQCENPEIAVAWLDYAFSEEGSLLYNFGVEGDTYTMVDGMPTFTDKVLNNPDVPGETALYLYKMQVFPQLRWGALANPSTVKNPKVLEEKTAWTEQGTAELTMPPVSLTAEEGDELAKILTTTDVYQNEMVTKFIMGVEPLDKFDEYVNEMKKMKIEDAIAIYQKALDRYLAR